MPGRTPQLPPGIRKKIPAAVQSRISAGLARSVAGNSPVKKWHYIDEDQGAITGVYCKCGVQIRGLVEIDARKRTQRQGNIVVHKIPVILMNMNNYVELEIEFTDGSKHVTPSCAACAKKVTPTEAEDYYLADLYRWQNAELDWDHLNSRVIKNVKVSEII